MKNWITRLRVALASRIAPAGTLLVPPLVSRPLPRADIAGTYGKSSVEPPSRALLITRCTDPSMWYAEKVGMYVPYCCTCPEGYKSREGTGYLNIVRF